MLYAVQLAITAADESCHLIAISCKLMYGTLITV